MSNELETYLRDPEPIEDGQYTTLQHRALDEVLRLSSKAVDPLESQVESEYQTARQLA